MATSTNPKGFNLEENQDNVYETVLGEIKYLELPLGITLGNSGYVQQVRLMQHLLLKFNQKVEKRLAIQMLHYAPHLWNFSNIMGQLQIRLLVVKP